MMKAIALDDEPLALQVIISFCQEAGFIQLEKTFSKTGEALGWLQKNPVDLILLDINMPSVSGIDFYKMIPEKPMVIFTTAYTEYAVEGFNLQAIDYLLKPFTYDRFVQAVQKAHDYAQFTQQGKQSKQQYLFVRVDYSLLKIDVDDILFIEGLDDYLKIHLKQQKPVVARLTMKAVLEKLPPAVFVRVHRSYIVSLKHIERIRNKIITIAGEEIPVGNSYEAAFLTQFNK